MPKDKRLFSPFKGWKRVNGKTFRGKAKAKRPKYIKVQLQKDLS